MNTNILLIDSVSSYREEVALQLEQLGYRAVETENGSQALDALREGPFDLIVMDNDLPDQSGFELIPVIRDFNKIVQLVLVVDGPAPREAAHGLVREGLRPLQAADGQPRGGPAIEPQGGRAPAGPDGLRQGMVHRHLAGAGGRPQAHQAPCGRGRLNLIAHGAYH